MLSPFVLILSTVTVVVSQIFLGQVKAEFELRGHPVIQDKLPMDFIPGELSTSKLSSDQVLEHLLTRLHEKKKVGRQARRMSENDGEEKRITAICGTSSSILCGLDVLKILQRNNANDDEDEDENIQLKCNVRKDFLDCIDAHRRKCRNLALNGIFPELPSKSQILDVQEKVWKSLWTSGGCLLGN